MCTLKEFVVALIIPPLHNECEMGPLLTKLHKTVFSSHTKQVKRRTGMTVQHHIQYMQSKHVCSVGCCLHFVKCSLLVHLFICYSFLIFGSLLGKSHME